LEANHATIARDTPGPEQAPTPSPPQAGPPSENQELLKSVMAELRRRAYAIRTEQTYLYWKRRFIACFGYRDPRQLGAAEVKAFLERLAVHGKVLPALRTRR
jgi:hypothetical protein